MTDRALRTTSEETLVEAYAAVLRTQTDLVTVGGEGAYLRDLYRAEDALDAEFARRDRAGDTGEV